MNAVSPSSWGSSRVRGWVPQARLSMVTFHSSTGISRWKAAWFSGVMNRPTASPSSRDLRRWPDMAGRWLGCELILISVRFKVVLLRRALVRQQASWRGWPVVFYLALVAVHRVGLVHVCPFWFGRVVARSFDLVRWLFWLMRLAVIVGWHVHFCVAFAAG